MNPPAPALTLVLPSLMGEMGFFSPAVGSALQTFAIIFLFLLLAAIPSFTAGLLAGWFHWNILANRAIRALKNQNAALRDALQNNAMPDPRVG